MCFISSANVLNYSEKSEISFYILYFDAFCFWWRQTSISKKGHWTSAILQPVTVTFRLHHVLITYNQLFPAIVTCTHYLQLLPLNHQNGKFHRYTLYFCGLWRNCWTLFKIYIGSNTFIILQICLSCHFMSFLFPPPFSRNNFQVN